MSLPFFLFMNPLSQGMIFSKSLGQSEKLVAVWSEIRPVPTLLSLLPALIIAPLIYSLVFATIYDSIPGKPGITRGFTYGIILWALVAIFFELFTPIGLFGEPIHLLAYELLLWFIALSIVGIVMGILYNLYPRQNQVVKTTI